MKEIYNKLKRIFEVEKKERPRMYEEHLEKRYICLLKKRDENMYIDCSWWARFFYH